MNVPDIKNRLKQVGVELNDQFMDVRFDIVDVSEPTDIEGLYRLVTVTLKDKITQQETKKLIWSQPLKVVTVPIVLNNAGINYFLMVSQSRFAYSGKVSIEINKGFVDEKSTVDDNLLWHYLLERKIPYLKDYADIVKVANLGNFNQHPDLTSFTMPFQLVFAKTKEDFEIDDLRAKLKVKHDYYNEPKTGPPLHSTQPVLKSFDEIEQRFAEIFENPDATNEEFYLNDSFSVTAVSLALDYIKFVGNPFNA
jgi:hypothetical protein